MTKPKHVSLEEFLVECDRADLISIEGGSGADVTKLIDIIRELKSQRDKYVSRFADQNEDGERAFLRRTENLDYDLQKIINGEAGE